MELHFRATRDTRNFLDPLLDILISLPVNMSKKMSFSYTPFMTCLTTAVFRTQGVL